METGQKKSARNAKLSYAVASFPDEVKLCLSGIPGEGYGVCAKQHIPVGTWIGPYEGKHLSTDIVTPDIDTSYMWEVCARVDHRFITFKLIQQLLIFEMSQSRNQALLHRCTVLPESMQVHCISLINHASGFLSLITEFGSFGRLNPFPSVKLKTNNS